MSDGIQSTALRYFAEVVRSGSLRRAAEVLNIAPSAISRQISHLEHRLQTQLFERHTNKLTLTEQGKIVAAHAKVIEAEINRTRAELDDFSNLNRGHVRVATVEAMVAHVLPKCIAALHDRYPNLTVSVEVLGTYHVVDAVLRDDVDIGLAFCPEDRSDIVVNRAFDQTLYAVMAHNHSLAGKPEMNLADLAHQRVALPKNSFGIRRLVDAAALASAAPLICCVEVDNLEMLKGLIRYSDLITFLPGASIIEDLAQAWFRAIPLRDPILRSACIKVLTLNGRSFTRAASAFLEVFDLVAKEAMAATDSLASSGNEPN